MKSDEWRAAFALSEKMASTAKVACVMALYQASKREYNEYTRNYDVSNEG